MIDLVYKIPLVLLMVAYFIFGSVDQQQELENTTEDDTVAPAIYHRLTPTEDTVYLPSIEEAVNDYPAFYSQEQCLGMYSIEVKKCSFGVTDEPDYVIALVGGSHSGHWFPALEMLAEDMNFQIDVYNHDGCRFTDQDPDKHLTEQCIEWNANLIDILKADVPDLVFTTSTLNKRDQVPIGYIGQWKKLEGITTVFAIRDSPRMERFIPNCLKEEENPLNCGVARSEALSQVVPWENTEGLPSNVIYADLSDYFCDEQMCHAVMGNIIMYRDTHHLTPTYVKTLAPALKPLLKNALKVAKYAQ